MAINKIGGILCPVGCLNDFLLEAKVMAHCSSIQHVLEAGL